ncbi:uncharacterized protein [Engystomops pustulosus]|uniref:uncharacterized protein isoform X2 n=1 Tax=Engystomops pustulosus TaxID=76066 RepID=UPI003AFB2A33
MNEEVISEGKSTSESDPTLSDIRMAPTLRAALVKALMKLKDSSFQRFKEKLSVWEIREEYKNIHKDELMGRDPEHVVDQILDHYRCAYGAEVTLAVLEDIKEAKVSEDLRHDLNEDTAAHGLGTTAFIDKVNLLDRHRSEFIRRITDVDPVLHDLWDLDLLTQDQYDDVMEKRTTQEKMRQLCDIIRHWEDAGKYLAYEVLRTHNGDVIKVLEMKNWMWKKIYSQRFRKRVNFIDRHRSHLIRRTTNVDPVLRDLLDQNLLTPEQYKEFSEKKTSQGKMKLLCDTVSRWDDPGKYTAYNILRKYNKEIINLKIKQWKWENPDQEVYTGLPHAYEVNFIDIYRSNLIRWIMNVNPVLCDLREQGLLTQDQYDDVIEKRTSQEKMEELCDIISQWEDTGKVVAYQVLRKYNEEIFEDMNMEERMRKIIFSQFFIKKVKFIDDHRSDVIEMILKLDAVLRELLDHNLLTREQYKVMMMRKRTSQEKRRELCGIISNWEDIEKYLAYHILRKYNEDTIVELEIEENCKMMEDLKSFGLTQVQEAVYELQTARSPMKIREMGDIGRKLKESYMKKKTLSDGLKKYNKETIEDQTIYENLYSNMANINQVICEEVPMVYSTPKVNTHQAEESERSSERPIINEMDCNLCNMAQEPVQVVTPSMTGGTYSLSLTSPGLFRCSQSGIQFRVTQPVTIEYEVDSWSNYSEVLQTLHGGYEIIGPLFNIKSRLQPNIVATVYLPHCLCIGGFQGNESLIRCFHYKDDNVVLEAPSRTEAMYAVLDNPSFSCIGVILYPLTLLKEELIKLIPYHGMVLLFCNTITRDDLIQRFILHLYLLPRIRTVEKEVEQTESRFSFQRIHKPHQTTSVYSNKIYRISGPVAVSVNPETLLFESHCPSEIYSFTEIRIKGNSESEVNLSILQEDVDSTIWKSVVSAEDMLNLPNPMSKLPALPGGRNLLSEQSVHFVDEHRADLIRMIPVIDPVLDDLLGLNLLTYEQYQTVFCQRTNPEQMRRLYDYIRAWGHEDKDEVLQSLRKHNRPIIRKLENGEPTDSHESSKLSRTSKCCIL